MDFTLKVTKYKIVGYHSPWNPVERYPYSELHAITIESRGLERLSVDNNGEEQWGRERWAVCDGGACLNKETLDFEYEPRPSSREEEWLKSVRFYSPEEALECFKKFVVEEKKHYEEWCKRQKQPQD